MFDSIYLAMATLPLGIYIKWILLFMPLLSLGIWHYYQDRAYEHFSTQPSSRIFRELQRVARNRSFQVIAVWMLLLIVLMGTDVSYQQERLSQENEPLMAVPVVPDATSTPEDAAVALATAGTPVVMEPVAPDAAATPAPESTLSKEETLDKLKQRYEDMLVSYYFLERCQRAFPQELALINVALYQELTGAGGGENLHQAIFSAARGSYESVYADTPCDPKYIDKTLEEYHKMINQLKQAGAR